MTTNPGLLCVQKIKSTKTKKKTKIFYLKVSSDKKQITMMDTSAANRIVAPLMLTFGYKKCL